MARPKNTPSGNFIYCTLANDQIYPLYGNIMPGSPAEILDKVFIKGGAGVATQVANGVAGETPPGAVTEVTDEELSLLEKSPGFLQHKENGFIIVVKKQIDVEAAVVDMNRADKSAPLTPADMIQEGAEVSKDGNTITLPTVESDNG